MAKKRKTAGAPRKSKKKAPSAPVIRPAAPAIPRDPPAEDVQRISCPRCGCQHLPVLYTRHRNGGTERFRECRHCGKRIRTRETPK
jgi:DNA-directed RNA polymerase subunit M/transcription elongation factor TFIIS